MNNGLTITSSQNPRIKEVRRLRESRQRRKTGLFLIDGVKEIAGAIAAGYALQSVFCCENHLHGDDAIGDVPRELISFVTPDVLQKICYGQHDQLPVAVVKTPVRLIAAIEIHSASRILVLDRTEKPGNLGACLRTAAACGIDAVVLTNPICELFNPNTIRASRGAIFRVPVVEADPQQLIAIALQRELPIFSARVDGQLPLWSCALAKGFVAVFGNEAQGLLEDWNHDSVTPFSIPMNEQTDSLNLSISCAVTLYESVRQQIG